MKQGQADVLAHTKSQPWRILRQQEQAGPGKVTALTRAKPCWRDAGSFLHRWPLGPQAHSTCLRMSPQRLHLETTGSEEDARSSQPRNAQCVVQSGEGGVGGMGVGWGWGQWPGAQERHAAQRTLLRLAKVFSGTVACLSLRKCGLSDTDSSGMRSDLLCVLLPGPYL